MRFAKATPTPSATAPVHLWTPLFTRSTCRLKSSNKPDFTFYEWHPQAKYRFNRECNLCTDGLDDTMAVAYMGDNNYVLSTAQFAATLAVVQGL